MFNVCSKERRLRGSKTPGMPPGGPRKIPSELGSAARPPLVRPSALRPRLATGLPLSFQVIVHYTTLLLNCQALQVELSPLGLIPLDTS